MKRSYLCTLVYDDETQSDITRRLLKFDRLRMAAATADNLYSQPAGTLAMEFDNEDGFWDTVFGDRVVTGIDIKFRVDLRRTEATTPFYRYPFVGYVLGETISFDRTTKRCSFTIIGAKQLLDEVDVETDLKRPFPALSVASRAQAGAFDVAVSLDCAQHLIVQGDTISFDPAAATEQDSSNGYIVKSVHEAVITLTEQLREDLATGSPVTCLTPYYRWTAADTMAAYIFNLAGIAYANQDIRYTGDFLSSSRYFVGVANFIGSDGYGAPLGMGDGFVSSQRRFRIVQSPGKIVSFVRHSACEATSASSGFSDAQLLVSDNTDKQGPYFDPIELGQDDPANPSAFSSRPLSYADRTLITDGAGALPFTLEEFRYASLGANNEMWELYAKQTVSPTAPDTAPGAPPDWDFGGKAFEILLRRYTSVNFGVTWSLDTNAFLLQPPTVTVNTGPNNSGTYQYVIEAVYNFDGRSSCRMSTLRGSNAANGPSSISSANTMRVTWNPTLFPNYTDTNILKSYRVWRVSAPGGVALGMIAEFPNPGGSGTWNIIDNVVTPTAGTPWAGGSLRLAYAAAETDGATMYGFNHSLQSLPGMGGRGGDTLVACVYNGDGRGSPNNYLCKLKMTFADTQVHVSAFQITNYQVDGCKIISSVYPANHADVYFLWRGGNTLVHGKWFPADANSQAFAPASDGFPGASLPVGEYDLLFDTISWNKDNAVPRLALCTQHPTYKELRSWFLTIDGANPATDLVVTDSLLLARDCYVRQVVSDPIVISPHNTLWVESYETRPVRSGWWRVPISVSSTAWVLVVWSAFDARWRVITKRHLGVFEYINAKGKNGRTLLEMIGFPLNAWVRIDPDPSTGTLYGSFLSRDLVPTLTTSNPDFSGSYARWLTSCVEERQWIHSAGVVQVEGATGTLPGKATAYKDGSIPKFRNRKQQLEVSCEFLETDSLNQVVAEALLKFHAPLDASGNLLPPRRAFKFQFLEDDALDLLPLGPCTLPTSSGTGIPCYFETLEIDLDTQLVDAYATAK